ncbi:hypothetical protein BLNAU_1066 [Blattamonas nauphoetae]|uniref:Protein kinase domain-containing protein n=1 Tax=Blattamonas nauphoetae TaxID=2049346 RepID=A0ABQ9YJP4_9EUKA|nr:hypothetical protein BLNAU_1066 [Blattamonas nauphoetae]
MNRGGSLLSHNTSFTHCHTPSRSSTNTQIDYDGQHFTESLPVSVYSSPTHIFTFCTFEGCVSDFEGGGAISVRTSGVNLQVKQCSFHSCGADIMGGALFMENPSDLSSQLFLSESSFAECWTGMFGGSVYADCPSLSISHCFFVDSVAYSNSGGATYLVGIDSSATNVVSDCLFDSCRLEYASDEFDGGGAVNLNDCDAQLSSLQFRGCSAASATGHDVYVNYDEFHPDSVEFCETTSPGASRFMARLSGESSLTDLSNLLTKPETPISVIELSEEHDSSTATFTLTLSNSITGDVLILLSNEDGSRIPGAGQAPNIGRVLKFTFSDIGTSTFTGPVGETKLFQLPLSDYKIVNAYLNGHLFTDKRVSSASCDLDSSRVAVDIVFSGLNIPSGAHTITLNNSITLTATFTLAESGQSIGTVKTSIWKSDDELKENCVYAVTSVTSQDEPNTLIVPGGSFTVPVIPPILKASCRIGSGTNHAWIQLTGLNITAGTFSVKLKDVDFSFVVTFSAQKDENGQKQSTEASVCLFGEESKLTFDKEYTLESLTDQSTSTNLDLRGMIITFSTPQATDRIVEIGTMDFTGNQKDEVSVSLSGADLTGSEYFITTSPSSDLNDNKLSATFSGQSGTLVGRVYSAIGNAVPLKFGQTYEILSITHTNNQPILLVPLSFSVPTEPARIESTSSALNGPKTEVTVTLTGRELFSATMTVKLTNPNTNRVFTSSLSFVDTTSCTVTFPAAQTETDAELAFGVSYDVVSTESSDGKKSFVVNTGVKVSVPSAPIIDSITSSLSPNCTHFEIVFGGTSLPTSGSLIATISPSITLPLSYENGKWTTGWLADGEDGMLMNTSYSVTKIADDVNEMILNMKTFTTALGPTLSSIEPVTLKDDDLNSVVLTLEGLRMPLSSVVASFDLNVVESEGTTEEITIPVSFSTNEIGSGEVEVYESGKLKYSTSYSVVRMTSAVVSVSIPSAVTFTTPAAPTRIISATCDLDTKTGKSAEIVLSGVSFPQSTPFTLTVFELNEASEKTGNAIELSSSFTSDGSSTSHTLSSLIYGNASAKLEYQKSYEITKLDIIGIDSIVDKLVHFSISPEPARLTTVTLPEVYSQKQTEVSVTLSGINLSGTFSVVLKSNQSETPINVSVTFSGSSGILKGMLYSKLDPSSVNMTYDTKYEIVSMEDTSKKPVFVEAGLSYTTMKEPTRVVSVWISRYGNDEKEAVLWMDGRELDVDEKYEVSLFPGNVVVSMSFADGKWEKVVGLRGSDEIGTGLIYGLTYTVDEVVISNSQTPVHCDDISFVVQVEPARIISTSPALNGAKTSVNVTLNGRALFSATMSVKLTNPNSNREFTSSLSFVDTTSCTVTFPVAQTETDAELAFGVSYDVVSIESSDGKKSFVVNTGVKVSVPSAPIIDSITSSLSPNCTHFEIVFGGIFLPSIGSFVASISPSMSLSLSYVDGKWTTGWLADGEDGMLMNTSYSVTKIADDVNEMILNLKTFTTALGPTLSSIEPVTLKDDDLNSVVLTLEGLRMPLSSVVASFELIVIENGKASEITLPVSFNTNEIGSGEVEVYESGKLKYSTSYSVVRMTSAVVSVSIPSTVTFSTPAAPTRIISAACDLDTKTGKSAEIVLSGVSFPQSTPFTLTVFELDDSNVKTGNAIELSSSFTSDGSSTSHTLSSLIYKNDEAKLKYDTSYEITQLDIVGIDTIVDNLVHFSVPPEPARLTTVTLPEVYSQKQTEVSVTLSGINLSGTFSVVLKSNQSETPINVSVTFSDSSAGDLKGILYSKLDPSPVNMTYDTKYEIVSMEDTNKKPVFVEAGLSFTTMKEPTRVVSVWISRYGNDEKEAVLWMDGRELDVDEKYEVSLFPGNVVVSMSFADGKWEKVVGLRGSDEIGTGLIYGLTYTVDEVVISNSQTPVHCDDISFVVQVEPARIISTSPALNGAKTSVNVTLNGRALFSATMSVKLTNPNSNREFTSSLSFVDTTSCTVTFPVAQTETDAELAFGVSYDVVSIESSDGKKSFVVNTGVKVSVPSAPIIDSITSSLSPNCTHFEIVFGGTSLPTSGSLIATISPSMSLSLSYVDGKWTTGWLADGEDGMLMNTSYSVTKVASGENEMILNLKTFTTPLGPTLSSIEPVTLKDDDPNSVVLTLEGLRMPLSSVVASFDLNVVESEGTTEEITIPVSFSTNEIGSGEVEVYESGKLKYSTSYSVVRMTSAVVSVSIPSAVTFTTPAAPTRIISATCDLDTKTGKSAEIVLSGVSFPQSTPFTLTVFELNEASEKTGNAIELSSSFTSDGSSTSHTLSSLIYGNASAKLEYQKSYEITKLDIIGIDSIVDKLVHFSISPEPARLTTVTLPEVYSQKQTEVSVTLSGINLSGTFSVVLKSNQSETPINVSVTFSGSSGILKGLLYSKLDPSSVNMTYDTKYEIVSMEDTSKKPVFVEAGLSYTTMKEPTRVVSVWISRYGNDEKEAVLWMDGRELDVDEKYEVSLFPGNVVVSMSFADGKWEKVVGLRGSDETGTGLIYGLTYTVDEVVISNSQTPVHCDDISFVVQVEPARIISTSPALNGAKTSVNVTLNGRALFSATMSVKLTNPNSNREFTSSLSFVDTTSCTVTFPVAQTETDAELAFGVSYDVVSIESSDGKKSFVVNTGVKVSVPSAPIIDSITSSLSPNCTHFEIVFGGIFLPSIGSFVASISPSMSLSLSYVDGKWTTGWLADGEDGMLMNTSYSVTKIADDVNEMILNLKTFTTALGPTLSSIEPVTLKDDDLNSVVLTLEGLRMPLSSVVASFELIVIENGKASEITLPVSFNTNEIGSGEVEVYESGKLKYSTSYSVVRMTSAVVSVSIPSTVTFSTPAAPTRIISAACDLDTKTGKSAEIVLSGVSFPQSTPFTLTVFELDDSNVKTGNAIELSSSFTSDGSSTSHTLSSLIYKNDEAKLKYDTSYEITQLDIVGIDTIVDKLVHFSVPPEPARLTTVTLPEVYSQKQTEVSVTLSGINLSGTFSVVLKSNQSETPINVSVTFSGSSGILKGLLYSKLDPSSVNMTYDTKYEIVSMEDSNKKPVFVEAGLSFTTMKEPTRVVSVWISRYGNDEKEAVLWMDGRELDVDEKYEVSLFPGNVVVSMSFADGKWEKVVGVRGSDETGTGLIYGLTYTVEEVVISNSQTPVHCDDISFDVKIEPARLIKTDLVDDFSYNFSTLTLTTRQLIPNEKYIVALSGTPISPSNSDSAHTLDFEVDGAPSITKVLSLYPVATLRFNHLYKVTSMKLKSSSTPIFIESEACSFSTPAEPVRIVDGNGRLNSPRTEAVVTLTGLALKAGTYSFTLTHSNPANSRTIAGSLNSDGNVECNHTVEEGNANRLIFGETYTITSASLNAQPILFNSNIRVRIPDQPVVTNASFHFKNSLNTTCTVTLTGSDLDLQGNYVVTLSDSRTLTIFFNVSEKAVSPVLLIGRPGMLQFNTTYTVVSIKKDGDETDVVHVEGTVSFETGLKPTTLTMSVDEKTGNNSPDCGDTVNPCSSVDVARDIASVLSISKVTLRIVTSVPQSQPWTVSKDGFLIVTNDEIGGPKYRIPSSASMGEEEGLIVVDSGTLEICNVSVMIENGSDSFVFIVGQEGSVRLISSTISGIESTGNSDELEDVCSWSSGILRLVNCITLVDTVKLTHLSQGAINMDGGSLTIDSSSFRDNTPNRGSFPSLRRNIICTGSATITIDNQLGGDGSKEHPSPWISPNDCNMTGEDAKPDTPMFIPTLSNDSTSTLNKKNKAFSIDVKGSTLIPCGLWLEIVEVNKDKTEGTSERVKLTSDSCSSISESSISLEIEQSLLSSLKDNLEWRGRLVFGNNVTSDSSFVIQKSSANRISQSVQDNMKWWLPLVIVLVSFALIVIIIVIVCYRRRKSATIQKKDTASTELDAEIVEKMDEAENHDSLNQIVSASHRQVNLHGIVAQPISLGESTLNYDKGPSTSVEAVEVLVCGETSKVEIVSKNETLFERLHGQNKQKVDAVAIGKEIVKGLRQLNKAELLSVALAKWTPHWILLDGMDRVCIRLNEDAGLHMDRSGKQTAIDDGERWRAPEQSNGQLAQNEERVAVFRLGLVLLEMRTGVIPFGELDGTNASRQLCAGLLPPHSNVDEDFMSIVRECLTINPNDRPLLMEVEDKLEQYALSRKLEEKTQTASGGKTEALQSRPTVEFTH